MYQWAIVGAGPAGIAAVGTLLDHGVKASDVIWIDPSFTVGDFGSIWLNVPSNTKVDTFLKFLYACKSFEYNNCDTSFVLNTIPKEETCPLYRMAEPLQWISDKLKTKVKTSIGLAENLALKNRIWNITLKDAQLIQAKNVILAVGAEPKKLAHSYPVNVIDLHDALNAERITQHFTSDDTIGVFGSSHSAILVLRNLIENSAKQIINFYRSPLVYAVYLDDWILFDNTGLKGSTADWARQYLNGSQPSNLLRIYSNEENIQHHLPKCTKVIYAIGFERRSLPVIEDLGEVSYFDQVGIIAPGLFGLGIAFPEAQYNPLGMLEHRVGLWKFMDYLQRMMPIWLKYTV